MASSNVVTGEALLMQAQRRTTAPSSEGTQVEISRAIAQVQGALVVAQQRPRDQIAAAERMREACSVQSLAERAFFRYSRGGSQITGPSIHLATELARCWGNVDYGITELRRDEGRGESEMLAYAWDLETNAKVANSFIVPHKRDKKGGAEALTDMRDIYENNANNAARRLRECIFRILPTSFLEEAKSVCDTTLQHGGGEPIEKRRDALLKAFADRKNSRQRFERNIGRAADKLTAHDIGVLRVIYQSIRRGEVTIEEEFPDDTGERVTADLMKQAKPVEHPPVTTPPAAETGTTDDAMNPATVPLDDAGNVNWPRWQGTVLKGIGKAPDIATLDEWWQVNAPAFATFSAKHPEKAEAMQESVALRRAELAPAGK